MGEAARETAKESQKPQTVGANAFAAHSATSGMSPFTLRRRSRLPHDVQFELIPIRQINQAYERLLKGDVKYRFAIDIASLK
jgi:D-arabinose 1-dehydrogenase-like Zn-dependent alcohol dehydrogenase